jgi:hypothetical protein
MISNLAYMDFEEKTKRMRLASVHPGIDVENVKESTGFDLIIPEKLQETNPPTVKEIKILREKVDPLKIRKLEILAGKEREELLNEIIQKELAMKLRFPKLLSYG